MTVIEHVNVLPMTEKGEVMADKIVVIENGRITSLGGIVPKGARRLNGKGKWLIPGLADMHVHLLSDGSPRPPKYPTEAPTMFFDTQDIMTPYIANGVTQLVNLDAVPASVGQRNEIASGKIIGPNIALAAVINGGDGRGRIANTPADGRQTVRNIKAEGYDFVKVYSDLDVATFSAIVDEANTQGMKVLGHIPEAFEGQLERHLCRGSLWSRMPKNSLNNLLTSAMQMQRVLRGWQSRTGPGFRQHWSLCAGLRARPVRSTK